MPQTLPIVHNGWAFVRQFLPWSGSSTPLPEFPPNEGLRSRICRFSKPPTRPLPQHDSIALLLQVSQSKSVGKCAANHHQCLRIHRRHGALRRRTIRTGGGPIMMTGISLSAPRPTHGWRPRRARISRHEFKYLSFWESRGAADRRRSDLKLGL